MLSALNFVHFSETNAEVEDFRDEEPDDEGDYCKLEGVVVWVISQSFILFRNRKTEHVRMLNCKKEFKFYMTWTYGINTLFLVLTINERNEQTSNVKIVQVYDDDDNHGNGDMYAKKIVLKII